MIEKWVAIGGLVITVLANVLLGVWWASAADTRLELLQTTVTSINEDVDTLKQDMAAVRATIEQDQSRTIGVWQ